MLCSLVPTDRLTRIMGRNNFCWSILFQILHLLISKYSLSYLTMNRFILMECFINFWWKCESTKKAWSCKVVRIQKKRAWETSGYDKVLRTFEFLRVFGAAEKIQAKVEANSTGFLAEFFSSQSVEMFCLPGKQKFKCQQLLAGAWHLWGSLFLNPYDFTYHLRQYLNPLCLRTENWWGQTDD